MLTYERAAELFSYDPDSGQLRWKVSRGTVRAGALVTTRHRQGYIEVQVDGRKFLAHLVIWTLMIGKWPTFIVDHWSGDGGDNRWKNLRRATSDENNQNAPMRKHNRLRLKGVSRVAKSKRYQAEIQVSRRRIYLGCFATPEEAHAAYCKAAIEHHKQVANLGGRI